MEIPSETTQPAPAAAGDFIASLKLRNPIHREGGNVASVSLREPNGTALLGLSLIDLVRVNTQAAVRLIPRISEPSITETEALMLSGPDLFYLANRISDFLLLSENG